MIALFPSGHWTPWAGWCLFAIFAGCAQPAVAPTLDASDASPGVLRSYSCTVADGGPAWTCKDTNGTTCAGYGCVPTP